MPLTQSAKNPNPLSRRGWIPSPNAVPHKTTASPFLTPPLMLLLDLPNELLIEIALDLDSRADISILSRTNSRLHTLLTPYLHRTVNDPKELYLWAIRHDHPESIDLALSLRANVEDTLIPRVGDSWIGPQGTGLEVAVRLQKTGIVAFLLAKGATASPDALMFASWSGNVDIIQLLLDHGADVNAGYGTWSPLHTAAAQNRSEAVRLLLRAGADIGSVTTIGRERTPLAAAIMSFNHDETVRILLEAGADVEDPTIQRGALPAWALQPNLVSLLSRYGWNG